MTEPVATFYVYCLNRRPVAVAIGDHPPDPANLVYDAVHHIPILMEPGRPSWRPFTWRHGETMTAALARARLDVAPAAAALPPPGGGGSGRGRNHRKPKRRRRRVGADLHVCPEPAPLGTRPDGRRYIRDPRTREFVLEEDLK
jgi:hypothetical protein